MLEPFRPGEDLHSQAKQLLPWYVNGTLKPEDRDSVEAHLLECANCRQDLETEQALARRLKAVADTSPHVWAAPSAQVQQSRPVKDRSAVGSIFRRRIPVGWALAAQAASFAILIPALALLLARPQPLYRTLGSATGTSSGDAIAIFKPTTSTQSLSTLLAQNAARIVDGPTSAGAYVLAIPADQRETVLARLRRDHSVVLAEPIDGDRRP
jgi:anti-sigma factor RsiW